MKRPWMPFYVADYLKDTRHLEPEEHGVYLLLIFEYWAVGSLPNDDAILAKICGISRTKFVKISQKIRIFFYDGWKHKRIDEELRKAGEISVKRAAAANARYASRDAIADQKDTHAGASSHSHSQTQRKKVARAVAPVAPSLRNKPQIQIPADFTLTGDRAQVAIMLRLDAEEVFRKFRQWATSSGKKLANWDVRWVMWCEDQIKFSGVPRGDDGQPRFADKQAQQRALADPYGD